MKQEGLISGDSADKLILDAYQQVLDNFPESSAVNAAKSKIRLHKLESERAKQVEEFMSVNGRSSAPFFSPLNQGGAQ